MASSTATNRHIWALAALAARTASSTIVVTSSRGTGSGRKRRTLARPPTALWSPAAANCRLAASASIRASAARDGRHHGEHVAILQRRVQTPERVDVARVQEHAGPHPAVFAEDALLETWLDR